MLLCRRRHTRCRHRWGAWRPDGCFFFTGPKEKGRKSAGFSRFAPGSVLILAPLAAGVGVVASRFTAITGSVLAATIPGVAWTGASVFIGVTSVFTASAFTCVLMAVRIFLGFGASAPPYTWICCMCAMTFSATSSTKVCGTFTLQALSRRGNRIHNIVQPFFWCSIQCQLLPLCFSHTSWPECTPWAI